MYFKRTLLVAVTAVAATLSVPSSSADLSVGEASFQICRTCHGSQGEGQQALHSPNLTGLPAWYIERQLQNYKQGIRGGHPKDAIGAQMRQMSMTLASDSEVASVAAYITTLSVTTPAPTMEGDAARGQPFYTVCRTCHGQYAEGMKVKNAPPLANLNDWYLLRQLNNFKEGVRGAHPKDSYGAEMTPMAYTLVDEQAMEDVIAYITSLKK
ncbi:c-type cytochrome [Parendozoicomonas sp. Alg238-R29]|uniref:c-type cytochrome n=1 Tax=Parendozoicomonas sp. Alg238-R29 TaxID=2993446 RepID=UPI00248E14A8|nr:c-type cytochrome [Parendozoicomonas sp. Alg238-R29]